MFKSFNWGHGIFVFYIVFVGAVVTTLIASFSVDRSLVIDDYYAQDIAYQSTYDKLQNNLNADKIEINVDNGFVEIKILSPANITGNAYFYRASDKSKDFNLPINSTTTTIPTTDLLSGKWTLKVDWQQEGKSYYLEEIIYL